MGQNRKRRSNGEGGVRQRRDGRWEATVELPSAGKRLRKSVYGKTQREALAKAKDYRERAVQLGGAVPPERMTVQDLADEFLLASADRVKDTTYLHYEGTIRRYISPQLGKVRIASLTAAQVDAMHDALSSQGLAPRTSHHVHAVLSAVLKLGVRRRYLAYNAAQQTRPPRLGAKPPEYYSLGEARAILAAARGTELEALFVLAITTGLRQGELLGLRWVDVDLTGRTLRVTHTLSKQRDHRFKLVEPKTAHSRRTIGLPAQAVDALQRHADDQRDHDRPKGWNRDGLVFVTSRGTHINPANLLNRHYRPLLKKAGVPKGTFHRLRHTYATNAVAGGIPIHAVSRLLGHSDVATTMRFYAHATPELESDAVDQFERLLEAS